MADDKLSRREREKLRRRREILKAAKWVFSRRGFAGANLDEVAARCELSKGTIYYYFGNKEKLFAAVMEETLEEIVAQAETALGVPDIRLAVEEFIENTLTIYKREYDLMLVFFRERKRFGGYSESRNIGNKFIQMHQILEDLFQKGIQRGEIKSLNRSMLASSLMGLIHGFTHINIISKLVDYDPATGAKILTGILFDGIKA